MPRSAWFSIHALLASLVLPGSQAAPAITTNPYLPGGLVNQLVEADGFLFAAVGEDDPFAKGTNAGSLLYRSRLDSLDWK